MLRYWHKTRDVRVEPRVIQKNLTYRDVNISFGSLDKNNGDIIFFFHSTDKQGRKSSNFALICGRFHTVLGVRCWSSGNSLSLFLISGLLSVHSCVWTHSCPCPWTLGPVEWRWALWMTPPAWRSPLILITAELHGWVSSTTTSPWSVEICIRFIHSERCMSLLLFSVPYLTLADWCWVSAQLGCAASVWVTLVLELVLWLSYK